MIVLCFMMMATLACLGLAAMAGESLPRTRMRHVYGYIRASTDKQALSPQVQREKIEAAAARLGTTVDFWFQDAPTENEDGTFNDAQSAKVPLPERRAGKILCERLERGDVLIIAEVDRGFRKLSDLVLMLDRWERLEINLVLCDFPMITDLSNPFQKAFVQMIGIFAEIERKLISKRTKEAMSLKKRQGHCLGPYAGYGFKWVRGPFDHKKNKWTKVRAADPEERNVMKTILKWKLDGHGFDDITLHLEREGVKTRKGKPWSRARVLRGFRAELELQANENKRD
jgi:DNA invertase Pin-like site-specific DNA recombinase